MGAGNEHVVLLQFLWDRISWQAADLPLCRGRCFIFYLHPGEIPPVPPAGH